MPRFSREVERLDNSWQGGDWPKWLDWIEIEGLRGWDRQRLDFRFPLTALVGENGSGKSTVLQAVASVFRAPQGTRSYYASVFCPSTAWEDVSGVVLRYSVRQGNDTIVGSVRKPTARWRGNPDRPVRHVQYIDLRRTQPLIAKVGYSKLTKSGVHEVEVRDFDDDQLQRLSSVLGRRYATAGHSRTNVDQRRWVPVTETDGRKYSGFHQGAGETAVVDLLRVPVPDTALVLIDEIETSLHPRAQRRLIRDLASLARRKQLQVILTTHSPYVLEELPPQARMQILLSSGGREVVTGVSAEFAMTRMDVEPHPELEIYVEDEMSKLWLVEIVARHCPGDLRRIEITPYGSAQVGKALGSMVAQARFARPTLVLLDGDQDPADGCFLLPGNEAPERVVFTELSGANWPNVADHLSRSHAELVNACQRAMTNHHHHDWVREVGDAMLVGGHDLWRAMVISWVEACGDSVDFQPLIDAIQEKLAGD